MKKVRRDFENQLKKIKEEHQYEFKRYKDDLEV